MLAHTASLMPPSVSSARSKSSALPVMSAVWLAAGVVAAIALIWLSAAYGAPIDVME
jgi:hypothetical protein